jgi:hypothetical protein
MMVSERYADEVKQLVEVRAELHKFVLKRRELREVCRKVLAAEIAVEYLSSRRVFNYRAEKTNYKRLVRFRLCKLADIFAETAKLLKQYKVVEEVPIPLPNMIRAISAFFFPPLNFGYGVSRISNFIYWWYYKVATQFISEARTWVPERVVVNLLLLDSVIQENEQFLASLKKVAKK